MRIHPILKAAALSLALAAPVTAAVPAQAGGPSFGFGLGFDHRSDDPREWRPFCIEMTDYQIRKAVAAKGFTNIYLNVRMHRQIQVRATQGKWVYLLEVSTCTGNVLEIQRLRHA
ncbi:MAG TPA: hypothetical protein VFO41_01270 [Alphaproteobacteria bacterium]|nr:hypothetical protein [Alphaproteobacteria bacterium]